MGVVSFKCSHSRARRRRRAAGSGSNRPGCASSDGGACAWGTGARLRRRPSAVPRGTARVARRAPGAPCAAAGLPTALSNPPRSGGPARRPGRRPRCGLGRHDAARPAPTQTVRHPCCRTTQGLNVGHRPVQCRPNRSPNSETPVKPTGQGPESVEVHSRDALRGPYRAQPWRGRACWSPAARATSARTRCCRCLARAPASS